MAKFRKKPLVVDAMQFFYDRPSIPGVHYPPKSEDGRFYTGDAFVVTIHGQRAYLQNGDWVITEPDGEHHYPCKPNIFEATYEAMMPSEQQHKPVRAQPITREALTAAMKAAWWDVPATETDVLAWLAAATLAKLLTGQPMPGEGARE